MRLPAGRKPVPPEIAERQDHQQRTAVEGQLHLEKAKDGPEQPEAFTAKTRCRHRATSRIRPITVSAPMVKPMPIARPSTAEAPTTDAGGKDSAAEYGN